MPNDLTNGKPMKLILAFTLPILIGNIIQQFYSVVDSIIVGRFIGVNALAAVGSTGSLTFLVIGWIMGMTGGFAILVAQRFGASDTKGVKHFIAMSLQLCTIMAIVMTVGLLFGNRWILTIMNTPNEIFDDTYQYIRIIYAGLGATIAYNILSAILRALGDSRTPLYFLVISSVVNIGLDLLFVGFLDMGVSGAGYATIISQFVSAILCFIFMTRKYTFLKLNKEDMHFSRRSAKKLLSMGIPMGMQFSITAIGTMIVQVALNGLGPIYIAAFTACSKIQNIVTQPFPSLGASMATFVGQNTGAGRMDRVKEGVKADVILTIFASVICMALILLFGDMMIRAFVKEDVEMVLKNARIFFMLVVGFYPMLGMIFVYRNTLQGLGYGFVPMLGGIFELIARIIVISLLAKPYGFVGICWAHPVAWVSALIPLIPVYYFRMKKVK